MADDVKTVIPAPGTTLYTGAGLHPFRPGGGVGADRPCRRPGSAGPGGALPSARTRAAEVTT